MSCQGVRIRRAPMSQARTATMWQPSGMMQSSRSVRVRTKRQPRKTQLRRQSQVRSKRRRHKRVRTAKTNSVNG